jgi:hypothetical protein
MGIRFVIDASTSASYQLDKKSVGQYTVYTIHSLLIEGKPWKKKRQRAKLRLVRVSSPG